MTRAPVVLIVDDHRDSLAMYAIGLLATGFEVVTATNAEEGFIRACACHPDLIAMDVGLSGASGLDLARRLRDDARTKDARIIALTGDVPAGPQARSAGVDRFLMKPCEPAALAREIHDVLRQRGVPRAGSSGAAVTEPRGGAATAGAGAVAYQQAFERICADYQEMPGMRLTAEQVRRLCGIDRTICVRVLDDLVRTHFLRMGPDGHYARAADGVAARPDAEGVDANDSPIPRRAAG